MNMKKRMSHLMDFAVQANYSIKIKDSKKIDKFLDITKDLKMLRNMKMTVMPFVVDALEFF